jgi:uncharacterized protein (DUF305 family)
MHLSRTPALLLGSAALVATVLSGCGDTSHTSSSHSSRAATTSPTASYGPAATGPHNAADVTFLTGMIPHHAQAVQMSDLALGRATDNEVKALATQIRNAQAPEIAAMSGWLAGWGESVPNSHGAGHDMGGMNASDGMLSSDQLTELDGAAGTEFARLYLTGMTGHHVGAVEMARTELTDGQNADAKALATAIIAAQSREIATMKALLTKLA